MIQKTLFFTVLFSLCSMFVYAQTEPEFEFEPYVFNSLDSTFEQPLPCENAYSKIKAGASLFLTGFGKVKSYCYINGLQSSLQIDKTTSNIIINTGGVSPQQSLSIIKLEQLKSKRRWKTGEAGTFSGASSNEDNSLAIKYKKFGSNSVIISIKDLKPGEYCLAIINMMTNSKSFKVYTFCIK